MPIILLLALFVLLITLSRTQAILSADDLIFAFWLAGLVPTPIRLVEVDGEGGRLFVLSMALIGADLQAWGLPLRDFPT